MQPEGPAKRFDRHWLDEASDRSLTSWAHSLHLDPEQLHPDDDFAAWVRRCGAELREDDEGGAVVRPAKGKSFLFLDAGRRQRIESELSSLIERINGEQGGTQWPWLAGDAT